MRLTIILVIIAGVLFFSYEYLETSGLLDYFMAMDQHNYENNN